MRGRFVPSGNINSPEEWERLIREVAEEEGLDLHPWHVEQGMVLQSVLGSTWSPAARARFAIILRTEPPKIEPTPEEKIAALAERVTAIESTIARLAQLVERSATTSRLDGAATSPSAPPAG